VGNKPPRPRGRGARPHAPPARVSGSNGTANRLKLSSFLNSTGRERYNAAEGEPMTLWSSAGAMLLACAAALAQRAR
jgi:hypothetical protein